MHYFAYLIDLGLKSCGKLKNDSDSESRAGVAVGAEPRLLKIAEVGVEVEARVGACKALF
jgi:hypothetical protein